MAICNPLTFSVPLINETVIESIHMRYRTPARVLGASRLPQVLPRNQRVGGEAQPTQLRSTTSRDFVPTELMKRTNVCSVLSDGCSSRFCQTRDGECNALAEQQDGKQTEKLSSCQLHRDVSMVDAETLPTFEDLRFRTNRWILRRSRAPFQQLPPLLLTTVPVHALRLR